MATAQILGAWVENGQACMAVAVNENGKVFEYVGRLDYDQAFKDLSAAQKKAVLVQACKVERDRTRALIAPAPTDLGLSGQVTI